MQGIEAKPRWILPESSIAHNADYVGRYWPVCVKPVHRDCFTEQSSCAWFVSQLNLAYFRTTS